MKRLTTGRAMLRMVRHILLGGLLLAAAMPGYTAGTREDGNFSYDGVSQIEVSGDTFDVRIQGTRSDTTTLEIRNYPDNYTVYHSRSGDGLRVWVEREFSLFSRPHHGELILSVPEDANVSVDNSTGSVQIRNLTSDIMDLDTSTGDIVIADSSASFRIRSATGEVEVSNCRGEIDVTTTTGDIYIEDIDGDIQAASSTGGHEYRDIVGNLTARSSTGGIRIDRLRGGLHLTSSTGSQSGEAVELTADSVFETSTGDIEFDFVQDVEDLEFDLRSTTGSLRVGREESQRRLFLGGRGFGVEGKSSTGSQYYY